MNGMRSKGKIAVWDDERGFGFVEPNADGQRVFVHIKDFRNRARRPEVGLSISYTLSRDEQGRSRAVHASLAGVPDGWRIARWASICVATAFLTFMGVSVLADRTPRVWLPLFLVFSVLTFLLYAADKAAAKQNSGRVPERVLHILSSLGGWPGALVAQHTLHHKTRKVSFQITFWATVLLNCAAFAWTFTPKGAAAVRAALSTLL
jgi:uncharacterized membrane protein YsdA (DUF1294 family)/cold shock CspA family protein